MKYIKVYEYYNSYYETISEEEYFLLISGRYNPDDLNDYNSNVNLLDFKDYFKSNWESFTSYELTQIKLLLGSDISINPDSEIAKEFNIPRGEIETCKNGYYLFITKLKDEWFIVMDNWSKDNYYKCDQFEGLIKYLTDRKK